jgi:hypothetical protein
VETSASVSVGDSVGLPLATVPPIPDLYFPQESDKVKTTLENNTTIEVGRNNAEYIEIPAGTTIYRLIERCKFARWTGIEWIFFVSRNNDEFFVRATNEPGVWEEVESEESSTPISGS